MTEKRDYSQYTVLMVDDEKHLVQNLCDFFEPEGFKTKKAYGGLEAIKIIDQEKVDAVVSDVRMPNGDGIELLKYLKNANFSKPLVLFMTGHTDMSVATAYDLGAEAVFPKPFDETLVIQTVKDFLSSPKERWKKKETVSVDFEISLICPAYDEVVKARVLKLGRGGMFVHVADRFPKLGESVQFNIVFSDNKWPSISGSGKVRWIRKQTEDSKKSGIGIEFIELSGETIDQILATPEVAQSRPFIPIG